MSKGTVYIDDGLSVDADYGYVEILTEWVPPTPTPTPTPTPAPTWAPQGYYKISFITEKKGSVDEISVDKIVLVNGGKQWFEHDGIEIIHMGTPLKLGKNDFVNYTSHPEEDTTTESTTTTSASGILTFTTLLTILNLFFK